MAATLTGVVTDTGRRRLAESFGLVGGYSLCSGVKFIIGEGGWMLSGGVKVPKVPDPTLIALQAIPGAEWTFEKFFSMVDVSFIAPSVIEFRCKLDPTEANISDISGTSPHFFELGIFDSTDAMIAYCTFDEQVKLPTKSLITYVQVYF